MSRLLSKLKMINPRKRNYLKYGLAAILLVTTLYPKFPLINVPGTFVSVRLEDFVLFGVAIIWLIQILPEWRELFKSKLNLAIFLFWLAGLASVLSASFLTKTIQIHIGLFHWLRRIEYMLPFLIGSRLIKSQKELAFYLKCLVIIVFLVFIYGVGQKHLDWPIITTQNAEYSKGVALRYTPGGHLNSTFAGHYDLASFLILISPVFIALLFSDAKKYFRFNQEGFKVLIIITLGLSYWLLLNAVSRISMVSFLGSISITLFLLRKYKAIPAFLAIALILAGFSPALKTRYARVINMARQKIEENKDKLLLRIEEASFVYAQGEIETVSLDSEAGSSGEAENGFEVSKVEGEVVEPETEQPTVMEDRSSSIRINVEWPRAIRAFFKNPLLGTGYSSISLATDNDYLRLLGETGILGFLAFLLILARLLVYLIKELPFPKEINLKTAFLAGMAGALPGILLNGVFIDLFEASKFATIFWLMVGFMVAVTRIENNEGKN